MKKLILIVFGAFALTAFVKPKQGKVTINLKEIKSQKGEIVFMLFNEEDGFPRKIEKAFKKGVVKHFSNKATYTFENVPYGEYAVAVFQDKDRDGEIKSNFFGMPKEPVGASNMTRMGRPSFKKCAFRLDSENTELYMKFIID